ncbi:MAG: cation transporter [Bacteroidetes bacterium]|nr:cation transporter [Bacteroidota bacterium]
MVPNSKKNRYGYIEGVVSIIGNLLLFGLKYWAGIMSGSLALIADAWHTLSDSASSVIVIGSVKLSSKKADDRHPFGHGRYQQIASIFIALFLGIVAWEFLTGSIEKFSVRESAQFGTLAIVVTVISILVKEGLAQYAYHTYRLTGFETLKADGWHHRSDALSSLVVLAGILLGKRFWWIDSVLGLMMSLMLFYAVFEIIRGSINKLLGEQPDEEMIREVEELISSVSDREICPHHFHLHTYGDHKELTFHIKLNGSLDIFTAHEIASQIEEALRKEMQIEATIHVEPLP